MDFPLESSGLARFMKLAVKSDFAQLLKTVNIKLAEGVEHSEIVPTKSGFLRKAVAAQKDILQFENLKDCIIQDIELVKFVKWLRDQSLRDADNDEDENKQIIAEAQERWSSDHEGKEDNTGAWKCQFVFDRFGIGDIIILSISGIGNFSFVAIVVRNGRRQAMRITKQPPSEEEQQIQVLLADAGLAPNIVERGTTDSFNVEFMQEVVTTLQKFIETTELTNDIVDEITDNILRILNELDELGVMHGDTHFSNWGLTAEGKLLIFDFDSSSRQYRIPSFDLAIVYNSLDDDYFEPQKHRWLRRMRDRLFMHLNKIWIKENGEFDAPKCIYVRFKWVAFRKFPSTDSFEALHEEVPELEERQVK
jgi:hypothetical protein